MAFLARLFDTSDFPARWNCGNWTEGHGWLHILSDLGVWSAYVAIPLVLGYFLLRRRDLPFRAIFLLFGAFILACGTTHLMEAIIFWWPAYRLAGVIKLFTAIISWATVAALIPIVPRVLAMRSPEELERVVAERTAELQTVNAALIAERERFAITLASIGDAVIATDAGGRVTFLNPVAEDLTGWKDEAIGRNLVDVFRIVNETTRKPVENPVEKVLKQGQIVGLANHTILIRKDGSERPIDDSAAPIRGVGGEIVGVVMVFRDIADRKLTERSVRESEERFRSLTQAITSLVWTTDSEGRFVVPQESWTEYTGQSWEQHRGYGWAEALHPDDRPVIREKWETACRTTAKYNATGRLWHAASGAYRRFEARGVPIRAADGTVREWVGKCLDVEDRERAFEAVLESEARYRGIGEAIDFGVWMCDAEGRNTYASDSFLRLVGITQEQCSSDGWGRVLHPDETENTLAAWKECVRTQGAWDREHRFKGVDGQWHYVLARGVPVRTAEDRIIGWVGINLDIDRLKQAEFQLREADRRKDEFLATLAHELRNPLAPVRNAVQVLHMKGPAEPELVWARDIIDRQMHAMARLLDDLLDVSRISRGLLTLRKERIELARVVQGAVETSRPLIDEMGHNLHLTLPPEPMPLDGDSTRLAQVFLNLLNNAAKYTERGGRIDLQAERQGDEVVVSVRDTGIGIPDANLPTIFAMFSQVEGALSRSQGGLGIGLTLVKRLVEMHGGSVEAASDGLGSGSTFTVRLPLLDQTSAAAPGETEMLAASASLRILVVDDNRDGATSLGMFLRMMGNTIRIAHDGEEAMRAAEEFHPQVVLLDIGLPKLNGYEVCRAIRRKEWGRGLVLIAVTGWGQEEDRRKSEEAGFDRHLVKPVDPQALMKLLAGLNLREGPPTA